MAKWLEKEKNQAKSAIKLDALKELLFKKVFSLRLTLHSGILFIKIHRGNGRELLIELN